MGDTAKSHIAMLDARGLRAALDVRAAVAAIEAALQAGLDPDLDLPRLSVPLQSGEFLLMPSEQRAATGLKVITVAPDNPEQDLPRIQGLYLLFDRATLTLRALLDGAALTTLRTPAVTMAAIRPALERRTDPLHIVVFGTGPQAVAHVDAARAVLAGTRDVATVTYVSRSGRAPASAPTALTLRADGTDVDAALARAGLVMCATTARTPLFDSSLLGPQTVVAAVGSHEPDARELDAALLARAQVIVESRATALRECGDVILAVAEGALDPDNLVPLRAVVVGQVAPATDRPIVFKSAGMSWEDLVLAEAASASASIPTI